MMKKAYQYLLPFLAVLLLNQLPNSVLGQTNHIGTISGTWAPEGNPHRITGDVFVLLGESLIIEPGVEVVFVAAYTFTIYGLLKAQGTVEDSIIFRGNGARGSWKQIYFSNFAAPENIIDYCVIKDGGFEGNPTIHIYNNNANVTVSNSKIFNGGGDGFWVRTRLVVHADDNLTVRCRPRITNNVIYDNAGNGVYVYAYYENTNTTFTGRFNSSLATPLISKNIFYMNGLSGISCYSLGKAGAGATSVKVQANPVVQQNTIYKSGSDGIRCNSDKSARFTSSSTIEGNPVITSNIISDNSGIELNANSNVSKENIRFNCFWPVDASLFSQVHPDIGVIVQTNFVDDSCDVLKNIFFDPQFVDAENFDLRLVCPGSSCLNAGDLALPLDTDGSDPDIGALSCGTATTLSGVDFNPVEFALLQNYPNPFNPETVIRYQLPQTARVEITIYNMLGRKIRTLINEKQGRGGHFTTWDGKDDAGRLAPSGIFFYRLKSGELTQSKKMTLLR